METRAKALEALQCTDSSISKSRQAQSPSRIPRPPQQPSAAAAPSKIPRIPLIALSKVETSPKLPSGRALCPSHLPDTPGLPATRCQEGAASPDPRQPGQLKPTSQIPKHSSPTRTRHEEGTNTPIQAAVTNQKFTKVSQSVESQQPRQQQRQQQQHRTLPGQLGGHGLQQQEQQQQHQHHPTCRRGFHQLDASQRLHYYLLAQQRRKEEFWLRKYGKLLATAPPALAAKVPNGQHHCSRYGEEPQIPLQSITVKFRAPSGPPEMAAFFLVVPANACLVVLNVFCGSF